MASVSSFETCPRCGGENFYNEDYYRTGEFHAFCMDCGKSESYFFKRGEDGKFVTLDGSENYAVSNRIPVHEVFPEPYGVYSISGTNGCGSVGMLLDEAAYLEFTAQKDEIIARTDIKKAKVSFYKDGEIQTVIIKDAPEEKVEPTAEPAQPALIEDGKMPF